MGRYREGFNRIGRRSREIIVPSISNAGALCPTRTTMVLMLVHLQGAAVIFKVGARRSSHDPPRCPEARLPQIQPAGEQERLKCASGLPQALVRKHTPGSRTGAHGRNRWGECGDVGTRVWPHSDGT